MANSSLYVTTILHSILYVAIVYVLSTLCIPIKLSSRNFLVMFFFKHSRLLDTHKGPVFGNLLVSLSGKTVWLQVRSRRIDCLLPSSPPLIGSFYLVIYGYKWLQMVTNGYKWLQTVTNGYKWLHMVTNGYKRLQKVKNGY